MSLKKRHIGRRVAGIGVGVALMVLGLQAPAYAATVASFTPTSGPTDCIVVVTGTGFTDFPKAQQLVSFVGPGGAPVIPTTNFTRASSTELWVQVPALAAGTSYNIRFDDPATTDPGVTSTGTFLSTTGAGACAPTITSFTPTCGGTDTVVTITGTNLLGPGQVGGAVRFNPYLVDAGVVAPDVDTATSLHRIVPTASGDGPIRVTTFAAAGGQVFSTTNYLVPPPDCVATVEGHARAITFKLKKSGKASGVLSSTEDPAFEACVVDAPVKIQKKKKGDGWKTKATTNTDDTGSYSVKTSGKPGKYRALAPKVEGTTDADDCLKAKSATRKI